MPKIYIAADHAGYALKEALMAELHSSYEVEDCGAFTPNPDDDYPEIVTPCAKKVASDAGSFGIVIGASGQGEAMAANRVVGVRAAVYYGSSAATQTDASGMNYGIIESARAHNDANILSLGARFITESEAKQVVKVFLETPADDAERHVRRRAMLA